MPVYTSFSVFHFVGLLDGVVKKQFHSSCGNRTCRRKRSYVGHVDFILTVDNCALYVLRDFSDFSSFKQYYHIVGGAISLWHYVSIK